VPACGPIRRQAAGCTPLSALIVDTPPVHAVVSQCAPLRRWRAVGSCTSDERPSLNVMADSVSTHVAARQPGVAPFPGLAYGETLEEPTL